MVVNKQKRECAIVDIAVEGDKGIVEKVKKYQVIQTDTDCCRIIRKCDEELGEVAGKLDTRICISLPPKNYASRNRKDFKKSISQF